MEEKRADSVSNRAASEPIATQLVSVVEQLLGELYPQRALPTVHMDSDLGRDLSIDSLGRVELISRLEETFRVRLPEELLGKAGNVRDLMLAVEKAGPRDAPAAIPTVERPASTLGAATPVGAPTLTEVLDWHVERQPERPHILLLGARRRGDNNHVWPARRAGAGRCRRTAGERCRTRGPGRDHAPHRSGVF
jgi:acyl carrier protein